MKIFVLNRGSSSIKCSLFELAHLPAAYVPPLWQAHLQWKNEGENLYLTVTREQKEQEQISFTSLHQAFMHIITSCPQEIDAIGHRIVHGGRYFQKSVLIDKEVKARIKQLCTFAPLHNLAELEGITALQKQFRKTPQVAVFDTAFHHSIPLHAAVYGGPYAWYEQGIYRYGFHGISFQYCMKRAHQMLSNSPKLILCHLGSGASLCAVKEKKSIDTTMGFTPLEGLLMDTRCGSIDPGILLHFMKKKRPFKAVEKELYHASGLLGLSGLSSDMRDIIDKALKGHERAQLALDVYIHRLNALIGSMMASLQGVDSLLFTGGIGENASFIRKRVCDHFSFLGLKIDEEKNQTSSEEDRILSTPHSPIKVLVVHTRESFEIACQVWERLSDENEDVLCSTVK